MGYIRRGHPAAGNKCHMILNRINQRTILPGAEHIGEDCRMPIDAALLRLLTQLANCGLDAFSPPLLRIRT